MSEATTVGPERRRSEVLLVAMPWVDLKVPSLQLGILKPLLQRCGLCTEVRSFYVAFMDHLASRPPEGGEPALTVEDYQEVGSRTYWQFGMGDWIFSLPPFRTPDAGTDDAYLAYLRRQDVPEDALDKMLRMRRLVPAFVDRCLEEIEAAAPRVVGFTSSFSQNVPSLLLAKRLKQQRPEVRVVFGGANCEGEMGEALIRCFPWVDAVVRGEAERTLPRLVADLLAGGAIGPQPGLCWRDASGAVVVHPDARSTQVAIDEVPDPDYDEYFDRLRRSPCRDHLLPDARLLFESARGCWWGEKMHCTFCGLNGQTMAFRSRPPRQVVRQIETLARRHRVVDFEAVDNIIDQGYLRDLLPSLGRLRRAGMDYTFFYETKANLKKQQLRLLREAGVLRIQPGIESLSTPILREMRKGVTALQNVRLLKWAEQFGIRITWNLLYGFPGEEPEEYARMARVMPSLSHLKPPTLRPIRVHRFSPYHREPETLGLRLLGPSEYYRHIYPVAEKDLEALAYEFRHDYLDGRDPEDYVGAARAAVDDWCRAYDAGSSLRYVRGPGFLKVVDRRVNLRPRIYSFGETEARLLLACDSGATPARLRAGLSPEERSVLGEEEIAAFLDTLLEARLVYEENGLFLSLPVPANTDAVDIEDAAADAEAATEPAPSLVVLPA